MSRILMLVDHRQNRRLLAEWLERNYQVVLPCADTGLQEPFDLAIVDGTALDRLWGQVQARKQAEEPLFLPVLLLTYHQGVDLATRHLWHTIDEMVLRPIEKVELQARVEILLRARRLSVSLQQRRGDLEAFIHAMTHELRAPLRVIKGFVEELGFASPLDDEVQHCLGRIRSATVQAEDLIASLLSFGRLGHEAVRERQIELQSLILSCLRQLQAKIQAQRAQVTVQADHIVVQADPGLVKLALTNLLDNALSFVAPGVSPRVSVTSVVTGEVCRIAVADNGIGISPEDQARLFRPFVRLHSVEEYAGIGLGLPTVRKAVELMGGRVGVTSVPGDGSTFWFELLAAKGDEYDTSAANRR